MAKKSQRAKQRRREQKRVGREATTWQQQQQQQQQRRRPAIAAREADGGGQKKRARSAADGPVDESGEESTISESTRRDSEEIDLIARFHTIQKRLSQLNRAAAGAAAIGAAPSPSSPNSLLEERRRLDLEIEQLGGLAAYQRASLGGECSGFDSSSWVLAELHAREQFCRQQQGANAGLLRLLDVGAIVNHYPPDDLRTANLPAKLDVTSIDLNPLESTVRLAVRPSV
eukprot:SAG31_NODE_2708_length_5211_cov_4.189163_1_plen_229_part_00